MAARVPLLMYHEIEREGRPLCSPEAGYVRYAVREHCFQLQLDRLAQLGIRGVSTGERLRDTWAAERRVVLTFDDGCETDLLIAGPMIRARGWNATFYVTTGFLGERGFLAPGQLRELAALGVEIGCHGATHSYLEDLDSDRLKVEITDAKGTLEQILGAPVRHFSCPGGRWNQQVVDQVEAAGFESMATSDIGVDASDRYRLPRLVVRRDTSLEAFSNLATGRRLLGMKAKAASLRAAKRLFGNAAYERLRARALGNE
jgi:peptidoglycan/xylan/chitin deacetylase (PgdA/CDA1 family)